MIEYVFIKENLMHKLFRINKFVYRNEWYDKTENLYLSKNDGYQKAST